MVPTSNKKEQRRSFDFFLPNMSQKRASFWILKSDVEFEWRPEPSSNIGCQGFWLKLDATTLFRQVKLDEHISKLLHIQYVIRSLHISPTTVWDSQTHSVPEVMQFVKSWLVKSAEESNQPKTEQKQMPG